MPEWLTPELALLATLTLRQFWGWIFVREHSDQDLARRLSDAKLELTDLKKSIEQDREWRQRAHALQGRKIQEMNVICGRIDERIKHLEENHKRCGIWRGLERATERDDDDRS